MQQMNRLRQAAFTIHNPITSNFKSDFRLYLNQKSMISLYILLVRKIGICLNMTWLNKMRFVRPLNSKKKFVHVNRIHIFNAHYFLYVYIVAMTYTIYILSLFAPVFLIARYTSLKFMVHHLIRKKSKIYTMLIT